MHLRGTTVGTQPSCDLDNIVINCAAQQNLPFLILYICLLLEYFRAGKVILLHLGTVWNKIVQA